jgi:hypothetical protein
LACPYLRQTSHSNSCNTGGSFSVGDEHLTNFCKNPKGFKKCATYKEWARIQRAPLINKVFALSIPILFYLVALSILLTLGIVTMNDWIVPLLGLICSVATGAVLSWKAA